MKETKGVRYIKALLPFRFDIVMQDEFVVVATETDTGTFRIIASTIMKRGAV